MNQEYTMSNGYVVFKVNDWKRDIANFYMYTIKRSCKTTFTILNVFMRFTLNIAHFSDLNSDWETL